MGILANPLERESRHHQQDCDTRVCPYLRPIYPRDNFAVSLRSRTKRDRAR
jgi:hypothetical protein